MWFRKPKRIYLDYAAATPTSKEAQAAMKPYWDKVWANPSAVHEEGVLAKRAVEEAREEVARTLRVRANNVTFTSGGTEANNLALLGSVNAMQAAGIRYSDIEIIATKVEHPSIKKVLEYLEKLGCQLLYVPIDKDGLVDEVVLEELLSSKTRLITLAYANSETGVVQDLNRLGRLVRAYEQKNGIKITFHTDASQAPLWLPCALDALSVDMMTLDAGKCFGPKGVGVLIHRQQSMLAASSFGGPQEAGLRPGTEPTPLVVGAAKAISLAQERVAHLVPKVTGLRDRFIHELEKIDGVVINGSRDQRLANNVNISIPGFDSEYAVVTLDHAGIAASTKSACSGTKSGASYVVEIMTEDLRLANSTIRFSLGPDTKWSDLKVVVKTLRKHLDKMKEYSNR